MHVLSFDLWYPVFVKCEEFYTDYYLNPNVNWAKKKTKQQQRHLEWKLQGRGFALGIIASLTAAFLYDGLWGWRGEGLESSVTPSPIETPVATPTVVATPRG